VALCAGVWRVPLSRRPATPSLPRDRVGMESVVQLPHLQGFSLAADRSSPRTADTCDLRRLSRRLQNERKHVFAGAFRSPLTDSNRRPPPYHALLTATGRNRRQRFWLVYAVSERVRFATRCHRLQPRGSKRAPSSVVRFGYATGARWVAMLPQRVSGAVRSPAIFRQAKRCRAMGVVAEQAARRLRRAGAACNSNGWTCRVLTVVIERQV
jgi:hypothetical protein